MSNLKHSLSYQFKLTVISHVFLGFFSATKLDPKEATEAFCRFFNLKVKPSYLYTKIAHWKANITEFGSDVDELVAEEVENALTQIRKDQEQYRYYLHNSDKLCDLLSNFYIVEKVKTQNGDYIAKIGERCFDIEGEVNILPEITSN